jgi:hypothetical protein
MVARAHPELRGRLRGAADPMGSRDAALYTPQPQPVNICDHLAEQPVERHLVPDDKVIWFALAPVHLLRGRWQGPGSISQMRRWRA